MRLLRNPEPQGHLHLGQLGGSEGGGRRGNYLPYEQSQTTLPGRSVIGRTLHNILDWGCWKRFEALEPLHEAIVSYQVKQTEGSPPKKVKKTWMLAVFLTSINTTTRMRIKSNDASPLFNPSIRCLLIIPIIHCWLFTPGSRGNANARALSNDLSKLAPAAPSLRPLTTEYFHLASIQPSYWTWPSSMTPPPSPFTFPHHAVQTPRTIPTVEKAASIIPWQW